MSYDDLLISHAKDLRKYKHELNKQLSRLSRINSKKYGKLYQKEIERADHLLSKCKEHEGKIKEYLYRSQAEISHLKSRLSKLVH